VGGPQAYDTYLLVANPGTTVASIRVTILPETDAPTTRAFELLPGRRTSLRLRDVGVTGRVGLLVESSSPVVAERSMFWSGDGVAIRGGTIGSGYRKR
jgi:hypothetical protein